MSSRRTSVDNSVNRLNKGTNKTPTTKIRSTSNRVTTTSRKASPAGIEKIPRRKASPPKTNNNTLKDEPSTSTESSRTLPAKVKQREPDKDPGSTGKPNTNQTSGKRGTSKTTVKPGRQLSKKLAITPLRMSTVKPGLDATKKSVGAPPQGMAACKVCGRNFTTERVEQHQQICKQSHNRTTKVFDSRKQRTQGTDLEPYIRKGAYKTNVPVPKNHWREKHEEFIRTIRYAKTTQAHVAAGGKLTDLPPPPPSDYSDYIQCPYCKRRFAPEVAERHIPKCKYIISNKK